MEEEPGQKNRNFLKKFVSKEVIRKTGTYKFEEVMTEDPESWKEDTRNFLEKLTPAKREARRKWAKEVAREEKKKKEKKRLRNPIEPPREFHNYQERKHSVSVKLSKSEKDIIKKNSLVKTPLIKKALEKTKNNSY